ncbi:MAG: FHA domain-containing protein [Bryobacteraceae bacterium]
MKANCSNCGAQHSLADAQLQGHARVQFRCGKCGTTTLVDVEKSPDATQILSPLPQFARSAGAPRLAQSEAEDGLRLPTGKAIALSVLAGPSRGVVFPVDRARVVLGRTGADLAIQDPEISRWHCALEIKGDVIRLRDLESTNGTYLNDERVRVAELKHLSEFRIGTSIILLSVTPKLAATS